MSNHQNEIIKEYIRKGHIMTKHTLTPWKITYDEHDQANIIGKDDNFIAICTHQCVKELIPIMEANAEFIVRAVNCHEELVEALKNLIDRDLIKDKDGEHYTECLEALAKAEGSDSTGA